MSHSSLGGSGVSRLDPLTFGASSLEPFVSSNVVLADDVRLGPGVRLLAPMDLDGDSRVPLTVQEGVHLGPAVLVAGAATIGKFARVLAGSVVTQDVPPHAVIEGNPARVVGYTEPTVATAEPVPPVRVDPPRSPGSCDLLGGAMLLRFEEVRDLRGALVFGTVDREIPFDVKRFFCVFDVPSRELRGEHAHRTLHELLVCVSGHLTVSLTDGVSRQEVHLNHPTIGLYVPPYVWSTQFRHSESAALMVFCSEVYDPDSYIRDFDVFLSERSR